MEAQKISAAASEEQGRFQGNGISGVLAFIKRIAGFSPVVSRSGAFAAANNASREKAPEGKVGVDSRQIDPVAGTDSCSLPGGGGAFSTLSLPKVLKELERLWNVRRSNLTASDLQYAMEVQSSLKNLLAGELERYGSMGAANGYQDIHSLLPVALLKVLLDIYCDALSCPLEKWRGEAVDADAVSVCIAEAARMLAMFSWVRSEEPLPIVWRALAAAYGKTRKRTGGLADGCLARASDFATERFHATLSRVLLLSLADPFSMQSSEIVAADCLIASHLSGVSLGDCWSHSAVAFDLEAGIPLSGRKAEIAARKCVVWISVNRIVVSLLGQVVKREIGCASDLRLGMLDLPQLLAHRWMAFPSHRQDLRTGAFIGSRVVCGAITLIQAERPNWGAGHDKHAQHIGRDCIVLDYSDGGCRVRLRGASYLKLSPGILVGIELPSVQGRSVGVISWAKRTAELRAEVGIRLLAREVESVPFKLSLGRWEGGSSVEFGLLAIGESGKLDKESIEIFLPRSKAPAGSLGVLRAVNTGTDFHVQEVIEVGRDFLRIRASTVVSEAPVKMEFAPFSI